MMQVFYQTRELLLRKLRERLSATELAGLQEGRSIDVRTADLYDLVIKTLRLLKIACVEDE
jgi:hypothetical protein